MEVVEKLIGQGSDLTSLQMSCRAILVCLITFLLIRVAGRRSFGIRTPMDNIIVILLGAILSRAVVGTSPFVPVIIASFTIALLHRIVGWLMVNNKRLGEMLEGNKILLYKKGRFLKANMERALVCEEIIMQGIRKATLNDDLEDISKVYIDRSGEISVIKKKSKLT